MNEQSRLDTFFVEKVVKNVIAQLNKNDDGELENLAGRITAIEQYIIACQQADEAPSAALNQIVESQRVRAKQRRRL